MMMAGDANRYAAAQRMSDNYAAIRALAQHVEYACVWLVGSRSFLVSPCAELGLRVDERGLVLVPPELVAYRSMLRKSQYLARVLDDLDDSRTIRAFASFSPSVHDTAAVSLRRASLDESNVTNKGTSHVRIAQSSHAETLQRIAALRTSRRGT